MGRKGKVIRRTVDLMVEQLEGRRFLSVGDLVPSGFGGGVAPMPLTETTVVQGAQTLTITGNSIERLNSDSSVDATFGTAGETALSFTPLAIGLDQSGNILVAGLSGTNFEVTRMDANGTIDSTYGAMGTATAALSGSDTYADTELAINSSGDVTLLTQATATGGVVQGDGTTSFVELARLDNTGNVDTTYGTSGFNSIQNAVGRKLHLDVRRWLGLDQPGSPNRRRHDHHRREFYRYFGNGERTEFRGRHEHRHRGRNRSQWRLLPLPRRRQQLLDPALHRCNARYDLRQGRHRQYQSLARL